MKDLSCGGDPVTVVVCKRRFVCRETACERATFTEQTEQVPYRAKLTTRLAAAVVTAGLTEPRAVSRIAAEYALSWPTVMALLVATVTATGALGDVDHRHVKSLGIDEHRFRRANYVRDDTGAVTRLEPWSIVFTDLDTGAILDVVDGRRGAAVTTWLRRGRDGGAAGSV